MGGLWRAIVDMIDGQISVYPERFAMDLRGLIWVPAVPFLIAMAFTETPSTLGYIEGVAMLCAIVAWTIFLFRRRAIKKRTWVEPIRYSDDNNGY